RGAQHARRRPAVPASQPRVRYVAQEMQPVPAGQRTYQSLELLLGQRGMAVPGEHETHLGTPRHDSVRRAQQRGDSLVQLQPSDVENDWALERTGGYRLTGCVSQRRDAVRDNGHWWPDR